MREKIVTILNQIALILEIKGENAFKIRAYKNGSEIIENYGEDIVQIAHGRFALYPVSYTHLTLPTICSV